MLTGRRSCRAHSVGLPASIRRRRLAVERLEHRAMLAADVGFLEGFADPGESNLVYPEVTDQATVLTLDSILGNSAADLAHAVAFDASTTDDLATTCFAPLDFVIVSQPQGWMPFTPLDEFQPIFVLDGDPGSVSLPASEPPVVVDADAGGGADPSASVTDEAIPAPDELFTFGNEEPVALAEMSEPANVANTPPPASTPSGGSSDAARLFAIYASTQGSSGADAQASTGIGGRRTARRVN